MLLNGVSIRKMKEGYSKPRNRAVASAFAYMKIIENWGSGIPRMLRECEEYGLPEPEFIDFDGDFRVNMFRRDVEKTLVYEDENKYDTRPEVKIDTNDTKHETKRDTNDTKHETKTDTNDIKRDTNDTKHKTKTDTNDTKYETKRDTNDTISESDARVLELIQQNPSVTQAQLKQELQISLTTVKRLMADLQKRGVIERQGSSRKGKWIILPGKEQRQIGNKP